MLLFKLPLAAASLHLALASCQSTYDNPIRRPAPDPSIVHSGGYYHMTHTSYDKITITRAKKLAGLEIGETKTIWTDTNSTRSANMWAPELHKIDNTWYMFYSSCDVNQPCCDSCQTRVLKGCSAAGPYDCSYSWLADLVPPPGKRGGTDGNFAFGIDGTYLEIPGKGRYHILSIRDAEGLQSIVITNLNTKSWTVDGWNVISAPRAPWERNITGSNEKNEIPVNEAPHPLIHGKDIYLSFSAASCSTPNYAIGLLKYNGGDPLKESSWIKSGPHFRSANGNYGTAHNCFFKSPDGKEIWNGFHATSNAKGSCGGDRYSMAQKMEFSSNGTPLFGEPQPLGAILKAPSGE